MQSRLFGSENKLAFNVTSKSSCISWKPKRKDRKINPIVGGVINSHVLLSHLFIFSFFLRCFPNSARGNGGEFWPSKIYLVAIRHRLCAKSWAPRGRNITYTRGKAATKLSTWQGSGIPPGPRASKILLNKIHFRDNTTGK